MPGNVDNKQIYHLGVLIPFWVLQLICEILVIAFTALGLSFLVIYASDEYCYYSSSGYQYCYNTYDYDSGTLAVGYASYGTALSLASVFLIQHIVQIALFGRRKLTPVANFGIELSRFIAWTLITILAIVAIALGAESILGITFIVLLWLLYMGSMIYASVIFHRSRRGRYNGYGYNNQNGAYPSMYQTQPPAHYGPGPYQHPGYQQPSQYGQPGVPNQPQHPETHQSPIASPQPVHGQPVYAPPPQHNQNLPIPVHGSEAKPQNPDFHS